MSALLVTTRYAVVIVPNKESVVPAVRAACRIATDERRLVVVTGDRGHEFFPTRELVTLLERFRNRARSSGKVEDRVLRVAVIFSGFYPKGQTGDAPETQARALAVAAGFPPEAVVVKRAGETVELLGQLDSLGLYDPPVGPTPPTTFAEALSQFGEQCKRAVVSGRAFESASAWTYPNPPAILSDLCTVYRIYGERRTARGAEIAAADRNAQLERAIGQTLAYEKPAVIKKYRTAVFPEMDQRKLTFGAHLKYSYESTRIYFWLADEAERAKEGAKLLMIAHAGCHLPTGGRGDKQ